MGEGDFIGSKFDDQTSVKVDLLRATAMTRTDEYMRLGGRTNVQAGYHDDQ